MSLGWFNELPAGWTSTQLRHVARVFAGGTPDRKRDDFWSGGTVPWLNSGSVNQDVITDPSELVTTLAVSGGATRFVARKSIVIALAGQGKTKGMAARTEIRTTLNQSLAAIEPSDVLDYRFLHFWLKSNYFNIRSLAGGDLRDGLNLDHIGGIYVPLPTPIEQRQIADYLDHETAEIDAFIADLYTAAALVRERMSADLERLVWSSTVEGVPLRRFLRSIDQGVSPVADSHPAGPGEIGVLKAGCTNEGVFNVDANKRLLSTADVPTSAFVNPGELIVTRASGSARHVGSAAIVPTLDRTLAMSDKHYRLHANRYADPKYLQAVMQTHRFRADLEPRISGAYGLAKNISIGQLVSVHVPNLSGAAQAQAAAAVAVRREEVSPTLADFDAAVAIAKERRAALITAAVTGQIDVRSRQKPVVDRIQTAIEEAR